MHNSKVVKGCCRIRVDGILGFVFHAFITFIIPHPHPQAQLQMNLFLFLFLSVPGAGAVPAATRTRLPHFLKCFVLLREAICCGKNTHEKEKKTASFVARRVGWPERRSHVVWSLPSRGEGAEEPHPWSTEPESAFLRNLGALLHSFPENESEPPSR